jgi:hypothetical protein
MNMKKASQRLPAARGRSRSGNTGCGGSGGRPETETLALGSDVEGAFGYDNIARLNARHNLHLFSGRFANANLGVR